MPAPVVLTCSFIVAGCCFLTSITPVTAKPGLTMRAARPGIKVVVSRAGSIIPFTMRVDQKPFNNVNVRQALWLAVDRPQFIDSALDGYSAVGDDVFSPFDYYNYSPYLSQVAYSMLPSSPNQRDA